MTTRETWVDPTGETTAYIRDELDFPSLGQVAMQRTTVKDESKGTVETETHFFITSLSVKIATAEWFAKTVRAHWDIENKLHHVKDRTLLEDANRTRRPGLGAVLTLLRTAVVNVLRMAVKPRKTTSMASRIRHYSFQPMSVMKLAGI